ncbi:MFS transporter, partial [bacterium]|nr:MFS transporter [bacterium]
SLAAVYFLIYSTMQIPSGVLADTLGPRVTIFAGNLTAGIGSLLFAFAGSFAAASAGRFLVGLGVSVIFISSLKFSSLWFSERKFALVTGIILFVGNAGSIMAAGPFTVVLKSFSWRAVFIGIGAVSLVLSLIAFLSVRNRPEDFRFPSVREMEGRKTIAERNQHWFKDLASVVKVPAVWPGFFTNFGITGGTYAFMGLWGIPYLRDVYGLDRSSAAEYMTVMLATYAVGGLVFGWISDRMGRRKPALLASALLYTGAWLALIFLPWKPGPAIFILFGLIGFAGTGCILTFACAKEVIKPALSGMATSLVNTGTFLGTLLMQPLFGWVLDRTWDGTLVNNVRVYSMHSYYYGFMIMLAYAAIGIVGSLFIKETYCANITPDN